MTVHLVLVSVCCCVANSSFTDLRQGEQPIETLHLEQINFKTLAPALNGESESRLRLRSGQCFALSEHFNLFKVKML